LWQERLFLLPTPTIDLKFGVIVDVEASRAIRQAEVGSQDHGSHELRSASVLSRSGLAAAYGAAPMLNWLVEEKGVAPHIPVFGKSNRDDRGATFDMI
jgi:hypothetical protein